MKKLTLTLVGLTVGLTSVSQTSDRYEHWQERRDDRKERMENEGAVGTVVDGSFGVADDVVQGTLTGLFGGDKKRRREEKYNNGNKKSHRHDYRNDGFRKEKEAKDSEPQKKSRKKHKQTQKQREHKENNSRG